MCQYKYYIKSEGKFWPKLVITQNTHTHTQFFQRTIIYAYYYTGGYRKFSKISGLKIGK